LQEFESESTFRLNSAIPQPYSPFVDDEKKIDVPESGKGDVALGLAKAVLSSVPIVGGAAAELFAMVVTPPLEKRRAKWMQDVGEKLNELKEKGIDIGELSKNEAFISTVLQASQAALRTHHEEKLEALKNAVINVAVGNAPNEDIQTMFINLVDSLTPWHIKILRFFQNPVELGGKKGIRPEGMYMGAPSQILEQYYLELRGHREFYDLVVRDLHARGLFTLDSLHTMMTANGAFTKRTTQLGDEFLSFISSPL
jgi:hypothetical protein